MPEAQGCCLDRYAQPLHQLGCSFNVVQVEAENGYSRARGVQSLVDEKRGVCEEEGE